MRPSWRRYWASLVFLTGAVCWVAFVHPFIFSGIQYFDARVNSAYINYFLNAISAGVYPAWDPYNFFGRPDGLFGRLSGDNNPFLFIVLVLQKAGVDYPKAYSLFYTGYFLFGMAGFFKLARVVLQDRIAASVAFFVLLFSSFGFCLFNDALVIMIFIPAVWFVYFARMFWRRPQGRSLLAMVLFFDVLIMSYSPFFIGTILLIALLGLCLLYTRLILPGLMRVWRFMARRPILAGGAFILLLSGFAPAFFTWLTVQQGEWALNWRSASASGKELMQIGLAEINNNGYVPYYFSPHYWVSCLASPLFPRFYVPVAAWCVLIGGLFGLVTRRLLLLTGVFTLVFLISIGMSSGVHPFLYQHVFYFKLFRNLHLLLWLGVPVAVLAGGEMFRIGKYWLTDGHYRWGKAGLVVLAHIALGIVLYQTQINVIWSVYAGVALSAAVFAMLIAGRKWCALGVFVCALGIQSFNIFSFYAKAEKEYIQGYKPLVWSKEYHPIFSFQRPPRGTPSDFSDVEGCGLMQDATGFDYPRFVGSQWVKELLEKYPGGAIERYVRNKFIVFERGVSLPGELHRSKMLEHIFAGNCGGALIESVDPERTLDLQEACAGLSTVVADGDPQFKVLAFGLNSIRFQTNWPTEKYLVYNDTYSVAWKAWVNGRLVRIDRVNGAFKGLHLSAGKNTVEMVYGSTFQNMLRMLLTWGYVLFALVVGAIFFKPFKRIMLPFRGRI